MVADEWQDATTQVEQPARPRRTAPPGWLLLGASFLAGVALASAAFVATWRHEAAQSTDAQAQLSDAQASLGIARARSAKLAKQLRSDEAALGQARARIAAAERGRKQTAAQLGLVGRKLAAAPARLHGARSSGDALAATATTLANDVLGLSTYLSQTPTAQLDPSYIATQLDYLKQLAAKLSAGAPALSSELASLEQTVAAAQKQAR